MKCFKQMLGEGIRERLSRGVSWFSKTARGNIRFIGPKRVYLIRKEKLSENALSEFRRLRQCIAHRINVPPAFVLSARMTVEGRIRYKSLLSELQGRRRFEMSTKILRELTPPPGGGPHSALPTEGCAPDPDGVCSHGDLWAGNVLVDASDNFWIIDLSAVRGLRIANPRFDALTLLLHVPDGGPESLKIGKLFFLGEFDEFLLDKFQRQKAISDKDQVRWSMALEWADDFSRSSGWERAVLFRNLVEIRKS